LLKGRLGADDVFVDVGCGQGRPFIWLLHKGYRNPMIGLELDPEVAERTSHRFERHPNVTIIPGDAVENLPDCGTLFYMYNPFDRDVMQRLKRRLDLIRRDTGVRVIYHNGVHIDVFRDDPAWDVAELDSGAGGHPAYLLRREDPPA
jgi:SAM-dependent methyltransferase